MNTLDIILILLFVPGIIRGLSKGFLEQAVAIVGMAISILFLAFPLVPNLWSVGALPAESYLIIALWSIFGLVFFRSMFRRDETGRALQ